MPPKATHGGITVSEVMLNRKVLGWWVHPQPLSSFDLGASPNVRVYLGNNTKPLPIEDFYRLHGNSAGAYFINANFSRFYSLLANESQFSRFYSTMASSSRIVFWWKNRSKQVSQAVGEMIKTLEALDPQYRYAVIVERVVERPCDQSLGKLTWLSQIGP